MLDNAEAVEHGLWNLRQLRNMLIRREPSANIIHRPTRP